MVNNSRPFQMVSIFEHKSFMFWGYEPNGFSVEKRRCVLLYKIRYFESSIKKYNKNFIILCSSMIKNDNLFSQILPHL